MKEQSRILDEILEFCVTFNARNGYVLKETARDFFPDWLELLEDDECLKYILFHVRMKTHKSRMIA